MGSCLSFHFKQDADHRPTAIVIAVDGSLKEYSVPVTASSALGHDQPACFLCNSDKLYLDAHITAVGSEELLQLGQIYFVLPVAKLGCRLRGADMVALAVRASAALGLDSKKGGGRGSKVRVMPVAEVYEEAGDGEIDGLKRFGGDAAGIVPALGSITVKKMGKMIGRRDRLSTIEEADE